MKKSNNQPIVTVVVVPRESFDMFADVVRQVYEITPPIFKMLIMEGHAPEKVREELRKIEKAYADTCKIIYSDRWLFPHEAVNQSIPLIDTEYVCYLDNDVEVMDGCIEALLKCAQEENAGCVHPIYLTTKMNDPERKIHVAEGKLVKKAYNGGYYMDSVMSYSGVKLEDYPDPRRKPSDYFEWHGVLFKKSLLDKIGPLDDLTIAEHIDYSLRIRQAGEKIILEPKAVAAYEYERIWRLRGEDREYMLFRWQIDRAAKSLERLRQKWNLVPESTARRLFWVKEHTGRVRSTYTVPRIINKLRRMVGLENMPFTKEERPVLPAELSEMLKY